MKEAYIFADESGDLGWTLDKPYRAGGSSRHLTVASVCVPPEKRHLPKRVVRDLYKKYGWPTSQVGNPVEGERDSGLKPNTIPL